MNSQTALASLMIRLGLSFVFGFAAVSSLINPEHYIGFLPPFLENFLPLTTFLMLFSIYEIILVLWLLLGKFLLYSASVAALTLIGITGSNYTEFPILFRNVAIIFSAIALVILNWKK